MLIIKPHYSNNGMQTKGENNFYGTRTHIYINLIKQMHVNLIRDVISSTGGREEEFPLRL